MSFCESVLFQWSIMTNVLLDRASRLVSRLQHRLHTAFVPPRICPKLLGPLPGDPGPGLGDRLVSQLCRTADLESDAFRQWAQLLHEPHRLHRKLWEFCYICQALAERDCLRPGQRGLGFAVGQEPLPALFASLGCQITASDLSRDDRRASEWATTGQWADSLSALNSRGICPGTEFSRRVEFRPVDMNQIPAELCRGEYDFNWSSCSFEHCGSLALGRTFLQRQMDCLRPGGVAVHTTEFNLSSNWSTIQQGYTVIYRRRDIERVVSDLQGAGHRVEPLDLRLGTHRLDQQFDLPPYRQDQHMRLSLMGYVVTSIGLIIRKGG